MRSPRFAAGSLLLAGVLLSTGCSISMRHPSPSPWALTYPDSTPVADGRIVRFGGEYGLSGPSPAFVYRDLNGQVTGQMLVWYRRYEPKQAGGRGAADSAAQWSRMESAMAIDRARMDSLYGCTTWAKGYQEGSAWVCRVPAKHGTPNWVAQLRSVDSLILAQRSADAGAGRRGAPADRPPPAGRDGATPYRRRSGACMDGGSWYIEVRDSRGTREYTAPNPSGACPQPDGPAKRYAAAGWTLLQTFVAGMR